MKVFGKNLSRERKKRNMSQKEFGAVLGLKQTTIANYENGIRFPSGDILLAIARFLNVSIDSLLGFQVKSEEDITDAYQKEFLEAVLLGDRESLTSLITKLDHSNIKCFDIYTQIMTPSLYAIGEMWKEGKLDTSKKQASYQLIYEMISLAFEQCKEANSYLGDMLARNFKTLI